MEGFTKGNKETLGSDGYVFDLDGDDCFRVFTYPQLIELYMLNRYSSLLSVIL